MSISFRKRDGTLVCIESPCAMGILNMTPDSFYKKSRCTKLDLGLSRIETMIEDGASIIDIGGESTRPGSEPVSESEELDRIIPLIEKASKVFQVLISVDTSSPVVMREAVNAGADIINDTRALQKTNALITAASLKVPVILMHSNFLPADQPPIPKNYNIINEVSFFLKKRVADCVNAGIDKINIIIDPGFGGGTFNKNTEENLVLINNFEVFHELKLPILAGVSRKTLIGDITGKVTNDRMAGSLAIQSILISKGVHIIRTHDVAETVDLIKVHKALQTIRSGTLASA